MVETLFVARHLGGRIRSIATGQHKKFNTMLQLIDYSPIITIYYLNYWLIMIIIKCVISYMASV